MSEPQILGNVNAARLDDLVGKVEDLDRFYEFLEPGKDIVIVERRLDYLQRFIEEIPMKLLPEGTTSEPIPPQTSSQQKDNGEFKRIYFQKNGKGSIFSRLIACSRLKARDNITEKLTRINAKVNGTNLEEHKHPGRRDINDVYGFAFVTFDEESCYELKSRVESNKHLEKISEKDTLGGDVNDYRAIHQAFFWHNGSPEMDQIKISVHYETLESFKTNKAGTDENPGLAHKAYTKWKLQQPHHQGNYQIVIIESDEFVAPPVQIDNGFATYTLIPGEQTESGLYVPKTKESVLPGGSLARNL